MRYGAFVAALALLVGACAEEREPLELSIPTLPGDKTTLLMFNSRPGSGRQYRVHWRSHVNKVVQLEARLLEPAPPGLQVAVRDGEALRVGSYGRVRLDLTLPTEVGPLEGRVEFYSDDLPGWTKVFPFRGEVVDRPREGRYLVAQPAPGVNLGELRPGETRPFLVRLKNVGDTDITILEWSISNERMVAVRGLQRGGLIVPGAEIQVSGSLVAPRQAAEVRERIRILSDAVNYPVGLDIVLAGRVVPAFAAIPPRLEVRAAYAVQESTYRILVRGREGTEPFVIGSVTGYEPLFDLAPPGGEPAHEHEVVLTLRRDAPTDVVEPATASLRFHLLPQELDVVVPVRIRVLPPIHAEPARLNFGRVDLTEPETRDVRLVTFANRAFEVTRCGTERGLFQVAKRSGGAGLPWSYVVAPTSGLRRGHHRDVLVIETDDPDVPLIRVPLYVELK